MECRIYAEDSENNFLPSTGKILHYKEPNGIGVRVDSGSTAGAEISIYYDPMIAKIICWDLDRVKTIERMKRALDEYKIAGVTTNIKFLTNILNNKKFITGKYDINFIDNLNIKEFINKSDSDIELENAASVFAAILKQNRKAKSVINNSLNNNGWWKQNYE